MARPAIVHMLGLGDKIRKYRSAAGLTQRKMAKILNIPYSTYSNYENGNRTPDADTLKKICDTLNISMTDLIGPISGPLGTNHVQPDPEKEARGFRLTQIQNTFYELNEEGQIKAVERIKELTEIARYRSDSEGRK